MARSLERVVRPYWTWYSMLTSLLEFGGPCQVFLM